VPARPLKAAPSAARGCGPRNMVRTSGLEEQLAGLDLGTGGGGSGSGAGARSASSRHNVGRVPELDYFARKLVEKEEKLQWVLPYAKAGEAGALPDVHASAAHYLTAMQAHTALEFQVWRRAAAAGWGAGLGRAAPLPQLTAAN
jgi:hypothetical protein